MQVLPTLKPFFSCVTVSIDRFTRHDSMDFKHAQLWSRHSSIAETLLLPSACPLEWFASLKIPSQHTGKRRERHTRGEQRICSWAVRVSVHLLRVTTPAATRLQYAELKHRYDTKRSSHCMCFVIRRGVWHWGCHCLLGFPGAAHK
jgi:hypothetical protein